ncbi:MAG: class I SAM-dependent methyltransferase [Candidatus Omnitrophica bacterium]|nr:class I SAM-dependent methyltransferase [Candidatus Omnitrophota bacterium]
MNSLLRQDQEKIKLFKQYGYDVPKARDFILAKAGLGKARTLEIGTGRGHMALALAKRGFRFVSIDLDKQAQNTARANLKAVKLDKFASFKIMDAEKLGYADRYFNNVISVNFIHHAKNPVKCIKEMARVTKEKLVIADLNRKGQRVMQRVHGLEGHKHHASKMPLSSAGRLLKKLGFSVKSYYGSCQTVLVAKKEK